MFYALIQLGDLAVLGTIGLFLVFYIITWVVLGIRISQSRKYNSYIDNSDHNFFPVSVVMPVADEKPEIFSAAMDAILAETKLRKRQIIVVLNGNYSPSIRRSALLYEINHDDVLVLETEQPGKRNAIQLGVSYAEYDLTVLLDSDSIIVRGSLQRLLAPFIRPEVGGVVPRQEIINPNSSLIRRMCNWYEDIRFHNTTPGLSFHGSIPCLIGRLYVVRTMALKRYMPQFVNQTILGNKIETGDDRVITSMLLQEGYKTEYVKHALVLTDAPDTLWKFAKQRLRWSRSSFRETVLTSGWLWRHPYAFFIMWADIVLRWMFFAVVALFLYRIISGNLPGHFVDLSWSWYLTIGVLGFLVSGFLKQWQHISRYPGDAIYTPVFLLLNLLVLFPVEIYGNLTCLKQGWLTRKTNV